MTKNENKTTAFQGRRVVSSLKTEVTYIGIGLNSPYVLDTIISVTRIFQKCGTAVRETFTAIIGALTIFKICFKPKVSIQPCWRKSD